ncbi:MAG: NADH-dependent [FeFe] hydrogenase, group A6 [Clostridiales bacterium]|nr:NADH-dependent [FeFe] hydrogenase, group A6 [Clostridiales bacterium]
MISLTIDGLPVQVEEGASVLDAARKLNINIPTLCYHPDQDVKANCRICVVENEGQRTLLPACASPAAEGMAIHTNSPRVRKSRRHILELLLARHAQDCLHCKRSGTCELQQVSEDLHFVKTPRYPYRPRSAEMNDESSMSIVRNASKCIACGRCEYVCNEIQTVHAISKVNRGFDVNFVPAYDRPLGESVCINCGQCVQVCPTGALTIQDSCDQFWDALETDKLIVAQVAPSVRINLAEALGEEPGTVSTGRLVTAMKRMGFHLVFDTDFTADLTIMEEGTELLGRVKNGGVLPMVTSCSPGWIKFCETYYPDLLPNLSSCKSPQGMFGALIKNYYPAKIGKRPEDICSVSIMPCTAKKFEARRPELSTDEAPDVDFVITVQELARMIRSAGIDFKSLAETPFDNPFGLGSGAGEIFGATGGVMEAALRTVYELVTGETLKDINFEAVRGFEGIKEAAIQVGDLPVRVAVAHGLGNARKLMDAVRSGKADYHFIEVMACPGGCIGGGGNSIKNWKLMESRLEAVYGEDERLPIRKSHENPAVNSLYEEFLGEPGGHKSHELLHTVYTDRSYLLR